MSETTLLKGKEAAERMKISTRKLWDLTAPRGTLPCVRIDGSVRYKAEDLEQWITQNRVSVNSHQTIKGKNSPETIVSKPQKPGNRKSAVPDGRCATVNE